ncbi:hypothetical protein AGMMS49974_02520 [Deltaproteobacteria bacterium]|nr:HipA domain-containing protein [Candidatus Desulfovibrio trichonymphae]GHU91420.1 hypothetical protein AGMMS49925_06330 [Deltaproteobacteria bacterium]GHU93945.1 hypothetical protein AGMMS49974_02520 [Deltaproteobacteria bacterium]GHV00623.1 hypothetical protein AGMMS50248_10520 [Deltaproteobacteria bacterium]
MAKRCGIRVPESRLIQLPQDRHALVLDRFDRDPQGGRIPFASAMTLLEARDNDGNVHSYSEIAVLLQLCGSDTTEDLRELWKNHAERLDAKGRDIDAMRGNFTLPPAAVKTSAALPPENTV